jgi:hypothetical protein
MFAIEPWGFIEQALTFVVRGERTTYGIRFLYE